MRQEEEKMEKREIFSLTEKYKDKNRNIMAVIVEGRGVGGRFFFSENELIARTDEETLSEQEQETVKNIAATGLLVFEDKKIFAELLTKKPELIICGGGHVAQQVIPLAGRVGFQVTVLEDRPGFADEARKAGADRVICEDFENGLNKISGGSGSYFLVVTRGHRFDGVCLTAILKKPYAYVGMMASRGRAALLKKQLESEGVDKAGLDALYTPVGLKIHAETPEEIAVSIVAELIQVKNTAKKTEGYEEFLPLLTGQEDPGLKKTLATIISRRGSAPRGIGTKMLVLETGRMTGTLGGGCMEAEVRGKCLHLIRNEGVRFMLETADLTNDDAGEEGLVCGGRIQVFLERI